MKALRDKTIASTSGRSECILFDSLWKPRIVTRHHSRACGQSVHSLSAVTPTSSSMLTDKYKAPKALRDVKRINPLTDKYEVIRFHHIDWWCPDATSAYKRFAWGLGMHLTAKSDQSTGNSVFASYVLQSNEMVFSLTAPYSTKAPQSSKRAPIPWYNPKEAFDFHKEHGFGVRAIGVLVGDAAEAYEASVANGAKGVQPPTILRDEATDSEQTVAEIRLYGDCLLRFVSGSYQGPYLAGFTKVDSTTLTYGLERVDHAVGNVHNMQETLNYIQRATGFHQFAEFTAEDVGTVDSGLNSTVLASNNEFVILPINEPTFGTPRKSQIQTFLEQNAGPGLQHLALKTNDIVGTIRSMRERSAAGGFDFMPKASDAYYRNLPQKIGDILTPEQYEEVEELGILVDRDDQGVLLQIFTQPVSDRPTVFLEIIQRLGCVKQLDGLAAKAITGSASTPVLAQAGGCGGFGKGNFTELFKSIEEYEKTLAV